MPEFEFREMLIENTRDTIAMGAKYNEVHAEDEAEHTPIGECIYCGSEIFDDDDDYVLNEEEETGICKDCLKSKCIWR